MNIPAGKISAGDSLVEAIGNAVASRIQNWAGCTQRLLDVGQAARYLGLSPAALRHKTACGEIVVVKIDSKLRYDRRDLDRLIDSARREGV
jgi:helix-turn-helix protein